MSTEPRHPSDEKLELARYFIEVKREFITVQFVPSAADVIVPEWLRSRKTLALQFGLGMAVPIFDLTYDKLGICGTLSFNGSKHFCRVPWLSVFAIADTKGLGRMWTGVLPENPTRAKLRYIKGGALLSKPAIGVLKLVTS